MDSAKKFREDMDNDSEYQYSSDSSDYSESITTKQRSLRSSSTQSRTSIRLPTRRPDPSVFNRNALMARENRRRKKEYIDMLEKDIEKQRKINKKLQKMLKRQSEYVQSLQNEKNYFKSILVNKTQILSLVNLVRTATIAQPEQRNTEFNKSKSLSPSSLSPLESYLMSDDNDYNLPSSDYNSWDDLLQETDTHPFDTFEMSSNQETQTKCSTINDEHSYFSTANKSNEESGDSGVCLHISGEKFSLEFCAACHENSKKLIIKEF